MISSGKLWHGMRGFLVCSYSSFATGQLKLGFPPPMEVLHANMCLNKRETLNLLNSP